MSDILIVDNDVKFERDVREAIEAIGREYRAFSCKTINTAVADLAERYGSEERRPSFAAIILNKDLIEGEVAAEIVKLKTQLAENKYLTKPESVATILTAYSTITLQEKLSLIKPVDDLVIKPVDIEMLKQKIDILVRKTSDSSHLYSLKTEETIDLARAIPLHKLGLTTFSIESQMGFRSGFMSLFYSDRFGTSNNHPVAARSYFSEKHPTKAGQYLIYFSFVGLKPQQIEIIRKTCVDKKLQPSSRENQTDEIKTIVIIDPDIETFKAFKDVSKDYPCEIVLFKSLGAALHMMFPQSDFAENKDSKTRTEADPLTRLKTVDLIVIDESLITAEKRADWIQQVRQSLFQNHLVPASGYTPIFLVGRQPESIRNFTALDIDDFILKPLTRNYILKKLDLFITHRGRENEFNQTNMIPLGEQIYMAKEAAIEELSECGVLIKTKQNLNPSVLAHFYSPMFDTKEEYGMIGRCLFSTKDSTEGYNSYFTFFALLNENLDMLRVSIRRKYIDMKDQLKK